MLTYTTFYLFISLFENLLRGGKNIDLKKTSESPAYAF